MLYLGSQKSKIISDHNSAYALKILLENFAETLHLLGYRVNSYTESALERFQKFDIEVQNRVFLNFSKYYDLLSELQASNIDLNNNKIMLWSALKYLGYKPCSDLLDHIDEEDVVEVYSSSLLQVYRNFRFMELCSYSVLDTFSNSWGELFIRPPSVDATLAGTVFALLAGVGNKTIDAGVDNHYLFELFSEERRYFKIQQKYISPVFSDEGNVSGVVGTLKAEVLGKNYHNDRFLWKLMNSFIQKETDSHG